MEKFIIPFVFLAFIASMISFNKYTDSWNTQGTHDNYMEHLIWGWLSGMVAIPTGTVVILVIGRFIYELIVK